MKVLKPGQPQKGWSKKFKCTGAGNGNGGCKAELLVEQGDIYSTASYHYDGSSESYRTFECAACGVETDISDSVHLPFSVPTKTVWLRQKRRRERERSDAENFK